MERLYELIKRLNQYPEPKKKKEIQFPTAVGTAGKGKTTFSRRAYENSEVYNKVVKSEIKECQKAGRNFRIACDDLSDTELMENFEASLGKILLYEALKYRLNRFTFESILDVILHYIPCSNNKIKTPLLSSTSTRQMYCFDLQNDNWLRSLARSSNAKTEDISLPLLKSEVILELANWGLTVNKTERINGLSEHLKYIIKLLGVVIFQMNVICLGVANNKGVFGNTFYQSGLRYFLQKCQYESGRCNEPLMRTKLHICEKYHNLEHFRSNDSRKIIPFLMAYTSFGIWTHYLDGNMRLKLPFLTFHEIYSQRNSDMLPSIKVLESLDDATSSDQNESKKRSGRYVIQVSPKQINEKNLTKVVNDINIKNQSTPKCIAYHNLQNVKFPDSFLLTDPPILIQGKQLVTSRKNVIKGYSSKILDKGLVEKEHNKCKKEHNKCKNIGKHIFLFVTYSKKRNDETYEKNEILIADKEKKSI
ncbi:5680_t:CDS:2 [Diversispora eburnea]|uniref:5680_t:CDS:1 n=1 Tax=Diversispora eburnea TaxID=1213867 RepID=A0A9N8UWP5_9GLOM|nr:5680_t:CDS:2 [Diversispora eburnea]